MYLKSKRPYGHVNITINNDIYNYILPNNLCQHKMINSNCNCNDKNKCEYRYYYAMYF